MKDNVILLTGIYRLYNLHNMFKSFEPQFNKYKDKINFTWVICVDRYNRIGSLEDTLDIINEAGINFVVYYVGKEGQPNYGGDLYNDALYSTKQKYFKEVEDPWVYIFDDDNIIHPFLFDFFLRAREKFYDRRIIVASMLNEGGITREPYIDNIGCAVKRNVLGDDWIYISFIPDPSQTFLKYSIIEEHNFFQNESTYDFLWLLPVVYKHKEETVFYNDLDGFGKDRMYSYHNGLRTLSDINAFMKYNDDISCEVSMCMKYNENDPYSEENIPHTLVFPVLSKENQDKIKSILKDEILRLYK